MRATVVDRVMNAPIIHGGVWVRYGWWYRQAKGTGMPIEFLNDLSMRKTGEVEALAADSGWTCSDCDEPLALGQPWCECGAVPDWTAAGLRPHTTPCPEPLRTALDLDEDAQVTSWWPTEEIAE